MDPATLMTVAQLFSLLADYVAAKRAGQRLDAEDFNHWLVSQGHDDVMQAIQKNQTTLVSVKAALAEGREELMARLADLDRKFGAVAAGAGPLGDLAGALQPDSVLSDQAQELLLTIERHQVETLIEVAHLNGKHLLMAGGTASNQGFQITDPRFYDDDMETLCRLALVSLHYNARGGRYFKPTRLGAQIGRRLLLAKGEDGHDSA